MIKSPQRTYGWPIATWWYELRLGWRTWSLALDINAPTTLLIGLEYGEFLSEEGNPYWSFGIYLLIVRLRLQRWTSDNQG